ncbi:MAG: beta-N-acetylhexosaminidase [Bacteroidia bacterium]|nr:beta-N-acetylhexosaminidase [Bacteroidia bacterium]
MKRKQAILLLILSYCFCFSIYAQYPIIPKPQEIKLGSDQFTFSINHQIECNSTDTILLKNLNQWIKNSAILKVQANKMVQTKISLLWVGPKKWSMFLNKLQLNKNFDPGIEGYVIWIEKNSIMVLAQSNQGLFYGFQSLKQLFKAEQIPCGIIYDKPQFSIRAWQDDISRGPIPTLNQLKKEIEVLSHYKLNYFTLYTENVFKYITHPGIAPADGITAQEIKELKQFAKEHYVTLIANQQSFGHMEKLLKVRGYEDLGEANHILSPSNERTYELLKNFYAEQNEAYGGEYFQINADETFGLGSGINKPLADSLGMGGLYSLHINRVNQLLQKHQKKIIMWSDIISHYPEIIPQISKDITLIPWAYHSEESFVLMLQNIAQSGFTFWVAPGINNWLNLYPNVEVFKENIHNLIRDGYHLGAKGVLNTSWDDDGFALFGNNWQGFIWGADISWNVPQKNENSLLRWTNFQKNFDVQFWEAPIEQELNKIYKLHRTRQLNLLRNEVLFEPIFPLHESYISQEKKTELHNQLEQIISSINFLESSKPASLLGKESINYILLSLHLAKLSASKNLLRIAYADWKKNMLSSVDILNRIKEFDQEINHVKNEFTNLYIQENRNYWLKENINKLELLRKRVLQIPYYFEIEPSQTNSWKGREYKFTRSISTQKKVFTWGKNPISIHSPEYKKPIWSRQNLHLTSAHMDAGEWKFIRQDSFIFHKAIGAIKHINLKPSSYHPSYQAGGRLALCDGKIGSSHDLRSGFWQGYSGSDLLIDLEFEKASSIQYFEMGFYQNTPSWVILPKQIEIYLSENGTDYQIFQVLKHEIPLNSDQVIKHSFVHKFVKKKIKFIRVKAVYAGPLPEKHPGAGSPSMMFADEIILR